jgi:hypothetical protein
VLLILCLEVISHTTWRHQKYGGGGADGGISGCVHLAGCGNNDRNDDKGTGGLDKDGTGGKKKNETYIGLDAGGEEKKGSSLRTTTESKTHTPRLGAGSTTGATVGPTTLAASRSAAETMLIRRVTWSASPGYALALVLGLVSSALVL